MNFVGVWLESLVSQEMFNSIRSCREEQEIKHTHMNKQESRKIVKDGHWLGLCALLLKYINPFVNNRSVCVCASVMLLCCHFSFGLCSVIYSFTCHCSIARSPSFHLLDIVGFLLGGVKHIHVTLECANNNHVKSGFISKIEIVLLKTVQSILTNFLL